MTTVNENCFYYDLVEIFQSVSAPLLSTSKGVPEGASHQTDYCFLRHYGTSEILHLPAVLCSACSVPFSQTAASLIYMGTRRTNLKPGPMYANHVNCYNILLPKLTSFHLAAGFTQCLLDESGDYVRHWASRFWCSTTFSFTDMFNSLLDVITLS